MVLIINNLYLLLCFLPQLSAYIFLQPIKTSIPSITFHKLYAETNCEDNCNKPQTIIDTICLVSREKGPPTDDEISDKNIVQIVTELDKVTDSECNLLVWKCLGYDYDASSDSWTSTRVFPKWATKFPNPPDLVGITRNFAPEVDKEVRNASMDLMRSIPRDFKGGVKNLEYVGFKGFKLSELTPIKTRRAQLVNWLIYYRTKLHGKTIEELRREREQEASVSAEQEVLPSERQFQAKRLDG